MKVLLVIMTVCIIQLSAFSQEEEAGSVSFVSYWSIGDVYKFKVSKIKQQWSGEEQTKDDTSGYTVYFEVLDSTADSYTIKWSHESDIAKSYDLPEETMTALNQFRITDVIYKTTEMGEFVEIVNWEEIGKKSESIFNIVIDALDDGKKNKKLDVKKAMEPIISIYSSKDGIEQVVYKELQYFHFPFGLEYSVDEPIPYEEELPNMFGGAPIRGDAVLYFESVDYDNYHCVLKNEMKLNEDDTKRVVEKLFKKMGLKSKDMKNAMKTAKFDISDDNTFEYYYFPGVPVRIETIRETLVDIQDAKNKRVDKIIIELVE